MSFVRLMGALGVVCLLALNAPAQAQWYQGPSGGSGGEKFDQWSASGGATKIRSFGVLQDNSRRCLSILYSETPTNPGRITRFKNGFCDPGPSELDFNGWTGIELDPDEYIIGIEGRYGDHIDALRVYTNKRNSPWFGGSGGKRTFGYTAPSGQMIVAFFGRAGDNLDAIGVMYAPCPRSIASCK